MMTETLMTRPKSKTQKKLDHQIGIALTDACDQLLEEIPGFQWLTHHADYSKFPASLLITCVFDTDKNQRHAAETSHVKKIQHCIQAKLLSIGVKLTAPRQQIAFDSEEACTQQQQGDWQRRLLATRGTATGKH